MPLRALVAALAAFAVAPAFSQALGTVTNVQGVATVTSGNGVTTLAKGAPVQNGSRIITTSSSTVSLSLNSGCTVTVPPGHGVTVLSTMTCPQLQAAVQPVVPATAVMGQSGGFAGMDPAVAIWGVGVLATVIYDATKNDDAPAPPLSGQ